MTLFCIVPLPRGSRLDHLSAVRARRLGQREALEHIVERDFEELRDTEGDRRTHFGASLCHLDALAVRDRQRALDGEPVAKPST